MATEKERVGRPEIWRCMQCGVTIKQGEAWFDDGGPLCGKHGLTKRVRREAKIWRQN